MSLFVRIKLHSQRVVFTFQRWHPQGQVPQVRRAETTGFSSIIRTSGFRWKRLGAEERQVRTEAQSAPAYSSNRTPSDRRTLPLHPPLYHSIGAGRLSLLSAPSPYSTTRHPVHPNSLTHSILRSPISFNWRCHYKPAVRRGLFFLFVGLRYSS